MAADWIRLAGAAALATALALSWSGFLRDSREQRTRTLASAARLFAAYGVAYFLATLIDLVHVGSDQPWKLTAALTVSLADELALVVAALAVGRALVSGRPAQRLGWGCLALAAHFVLLASAYGLELAAVFDFFTPSGRYLGTQVAEAAGSLVAAIASLKAAIAFATGESWRDRELGVAAVLFLVGFLTVACGEVVSAVPEGRVAYWLSTAYEVMLAIAAGTGAKAFFTSRAARPS